MDMEAYTQAMNRAFVINVITQKLGSASMEQLIEIGKILKL